MKKDTILISVIVPVYNVMPYLREAIDSVRNQSYRNLEIIIVDDGSTDGSEEICSHYAKIDKRIRLIKQPNKGLSAARNVGLDLATGEYVTFLDPDDAYLKTFIEKMLAALITTKADVAVCRYKVIKTERNLKDKGKAYPSINPGTCNRTEALRFLVDGSLNCSVWNKIYRRELWNIVRFPLGHVFEDMETMFKILDSSKLISVLDEPLYLHRKRIGSITATISAKNMRDRYLAYAHFVSFVTSHSPGLFSVEDVMHCHRSYLNSMIISYTKCPSVTLREKLRKKIIRTGRELEIEKLGFRSRAAYGMLCTCPWLLKVVYKIYLPVRLLVNLCIEM